MNFDMSTTNHHHQTNNNNNSGLLRYRSAPSSLLNSYKIANSNEGFGGYRASTPEGLGLASGNLISSPQGCQQDLGDVDNKPSLGNGYSLNSQLPPQYPRQSSGMDTPYRVVGSVGMDQPKKGSNLMRQTSSPAGLFSHLTAPQNGYSAIRDVGGYRVANGATGDISPSSNRVKGQMNFSSGLPSSLGMLSQISEIDGDNPDDAKLASGNDGDPQFYCSDYPFSSWNDSLPFTENFTNGLKREVEDDGKLFASSQNGEFGNRTPMLSHHLSLPKTSAEMAVMEKLLQFQDYVPCKIRAKRGCATHPRSIAERVRRTRISERMRKLQELVPNMDKQTHTADMLDLAVDYIKDLQKQFKILSDSRANCKCSSIQKLVPS